LSASIHHQIVIVGGGTAGISVAARVAMKRRPKLDVAVVEPSQRHFYQPMWTLVGGGMAPKQSTVRPESSVIPRGVAWHQQVVAQFEPDQNRLVMQDGTTITYDWLVVAAGLQINWDAIPGLKESLGEHGVCSNYSFDSVDSTWRTINQFSGGTALFTHPAGPVKCGGAPQKIMYLADDWFRRHGVRDRSQVIFATALPNLFAVEAYRKTLEQVVERRGIECRFQYDLAEIRSAAKEAVFKRLDTGELITIPYEMLHVTPPMVAPEFIAKSQLADASGFAEVDPQTLQHRRYQNVFAIGDCSNLPTSKTTAAIRKQTPVMVANLFAAINGKPRVAAYAGYSSCPLVTGIGKVVLAEFGYDKKPDETFPVDQSQERWSMWLLKRYLLPLLYWHGMLKGRL
jgi:sulfide:quinone oxidoreductase